MPAIGLCKGALGETGKKINTYFTQGSMVPNYRIGNFNTHTIIQLGTHKRKSMDVKKQVEALTYHLIIVPLLQFK